MTSTPEVSVEDMDGKAVARAWTMIDEIAAANGIAGIGDFFAVDADSLERVLDDVDDWPDDAAETFFDAADGLRWLDALEAALATASSLDGRDDVMRDLRDYRTVLQQAAAAGAGWHFAVDF